MGPVWNLTWLDNSHRFRALIVKDRVGGQGRSFGYKFAANAAFELMDGAELVSRWMNTRLDPLGGISHRETVH